MAALPLPWISCCELPKRSGKFGSQEWQLTRRFRVITSPDEPIPGPAVVTACPDIPVLFSSYVDFSTQELIPNAILVDYDAEEQGHPREWIVTCLYSTQQPAPANAGGLQSGPTPSRPGGSGGGSGTNPDDPTQLLPKVSTGSEIIRIPYRKDPQGKARWTFSNGVPIIGEFENYTNSAGERFASGTSFEIALESFHVSLYRAEYNRYRVINNRVNFEPWDGFDARTMLLKPVRQTRERFGNRWFWLNQFDFIYDPDFFHTFTQLNAGFRELTTPLVAGEPGVRKLRDITINGQKTSVEWGLDLNGQKILDPGPNGEELVYAEFNKYKASSEFESRIPFKLSDFGID